MLRWLSFDRRHSIAMWLRDRAAGMAEWVCPELNPNVARAQSVRGYVLAFAAAVVVAFLIWDASAGATLPGATVSNRAGAASW